MLVNRFQCLFFRMFNTVCFHFLQGIRIYKLVDIKVSGSHVACQVTFNRSGIKATLFSNLLYSIALVIKPIRIFKSVQFLAGLIAEFLFFLLFGRMGIICRTDFLTVIATPEVIIFHMALDNADNLLAISIELGRAYPRHLHEFG